MSFLELVNRRELAQLQSAIESIPGGGMCFPGGGLPPRLLLKPACCQRAPLDSIKLRNQVLQELTGLSLKLLEVLRRVMEARPGIEPRSAALQAAA